MMIRLPLLVAAVAVLLGSFAPVTAAPKPGKVLRKIKNPVKGVFNSFGGSVADFGGTPLVGAPQDSDPVAFAGAVYVIWSKKDYFPMRDPNAVLGDNLGRQMVPSNAYVASGVYNRDIGMAANAGAVVIMNVITGEVDRTIENPAPADFDSFGFDVAMDDPMVVIASLEDDNHGENVGSAFVYDRGTGNLLAELAPETTHTEQYFGSAVALSTNYIAVSATGEDSNEGAVHVYDRATRNFVRRIPNPEPGQVDFFGSALAAHGDILASASNNTGVTTETVYLFDLASGNLLHTLPNPSGRPFEHYGRAIAPVGTKYFAIGAPFAYNKKGRQTGALHVFDATTGALAFTVQGPGKKDSDQFGRSVAAYGLDILVGSPGYREGAGRAYVIKGVDE